MGMWLASILPDWNFFWGLLLSTLLGVVKGVFIGIPLGAAALWVMRAVFPRVIDLLHYGLYSNEPPPSLRPPPQVRGWRRVGLWLISVARSFARLFDWKPIKTLLWLIGVRIAATLRLQTEEIRGHDLHHLARLFIEATILQEMTGRSFAIGFPEDPKHFRESVDANSEARRQFDQEIKDRFFALAKAETPAATVPSCFTVFGHSHRIRQYFIGIAASPPGPGFLARAGRGLRLLIGNAKDTPPARHEDLKMLTELTIASGFLAPLHLVSGLLSNFDNDWPKIIRGYGQRMKDLEDPKVDLLHGQGELRKLQSFLWDCWIQWGPSIPICTGDGWAPPADIEAASQIVAFQFGYGDENNSLPVFDGNNRLVQDARKLWTAPGSAVAVPVGMRGRICHSSRTALGAPFCFAQSELGREAGDSEERGRLSIEYLKLWPEGDAHAGDPETKAESSGTTPSVAFYSAYVWVIMVICREGKPLFDPTGPDAWRGLVPFFQHANIADRQVYDDLKHQLASQAVGFLSTHLERGLRDAGLEFRYGCSFDENGTNTGKPLVDFGYPTIRELMERVWIEGGRPAGIDTSLDAVAALSSCHLPTIVHDYFAFLERC